MNSTGIIFYKTEKNMEWACFSSRNCYYYNVLLTFYENGAKRNEAPKFCQQNRIL